MPKNVPGSSMFPSPRVPQWYCISSVSVVQHHDQQSDWYTQGTHSDFISFTLTHLCVCVCVCVCVFICVFSSRQFSLVAQMAKHLPEMQEIRVWSMGQKDPLERGMATHSSHLAWRIPWTEEPGGLKSVGLQRVGHDWATNTYKCIQIHVTTTTVKIQSCPAHQGVPLKEAFAFHTEIAFFPSDLKKRRIIYRRASWWKFATISSAIYFTLLLLLFIF